MEILSSVETSFADSYSEARAKFLSACTGADVKAWVNPNKGPKGEELACDAAWFGDAKAPRVMVVISATHGAEGYCGSGIQLDWLDGGGAQHLGPDTAVLMIHGLNCYGFAWDRRVTEEGADLNRNFLDFSQPLPENPGHDELVDAFVPPSLDEKTLEEAESKLAAYRAEHGEKAFQSARKAGQYRHAHSMFFGGFEATWANRTLGEVFDHFQLASREIVSVVDVHTGLGPFGYGEPICGHKRGTVALDRVLSMYGDSTGLPAEGASFSIPLNGSQGNFWRPRLEDRYTYVALEFGTYSQDNSRKSLRADHWLHNQGSFDWDDEQVRAIKNAIKQHYYPATPDWKEMVLWRGRQILRQTLEGLGRF